MEWTRVYGPAVRTVGPFGGERMIFLRPEALHKITVSDCADYERVSFSESSLLADLTDEQLSAEAHEELVGTCSRIWSIDNIWQ